MRASRARHASGWAAYDGGMTTSPERPVRRSSLAAPRGYCAGVDRAVIDGREGPRAVRRSGLRAQADRPQQARRADPARQRGAIFVDETDEVPEGAHRGLLAPTASRPVVHERGGRAAARTIDATCPLVTKVHNEARRFADEDYDILLIGHEGHEEVIGTDRRGARRTSRWSTARSDVDEVEVRDPDEGRLALPDHAVGRRDAGDGRPAAGAVPAAHRPAQRRHLLRHAEPPARR